MRRLLGPGRVEGFRRGQHRARLDVGLALREGVEDVLRYAEAERQHVLGRHVDPVRDREGAVLGKGAVVKREDEVAGHVANGLDRVTVALGEDP